MRHNRHNRDELNAPLLVACGGTAVLWALIFALGLTALLARGVL